MKFFILLIAFSLSLSGYCAAASASAFVDLPIQAKIKNVIMADMPDCPKMKIHKSDKDRTQKTTKNVTMNCKACCMSLVGFPVFVTAHNIELESLKLSISNSIVHSDIRFPIFHPPNL